MFTPQSAQDGPRENLPVSVSVLIYLIIPHFESGSCCRAAVVSAFSVDSCMVDAGSWAGADQSGRAGALLAGVV